MTSAGNAGDGGSDGGEAAAYGHFMKGDYDRAVEALQKLPQRLRSEARVQHNLAVAAFYRGGCIETKRLLDALGSLAGNAATSSSTTPTSSSSEGGASMAIPGGDEGSGTTAVMGLATLRYNQAVLCYHLRRYSMALDVLEGQLYRNIEALDEHLALRVCLLLAEVLLGTPPPFDRFFFSINPF